MPTLTYSVQDEAGKNLAAAATIATRYSAVRRQGFGEDDATEVQIIDYKQQQHRIFPLLAASYCFFFTGKKVLQRLKDIELRLVSNGIVSKTEVADIHASTSSLKSFTTTVTADGIEDCRKACGGHGFLMCSGLPELLTTYLQSPTVEGDNQMLPQQVAKVLLKLVEAASNGLDLSVYENCDSSLLIPSLKKILSGSNEQCPAMSADDLMELTLLQKAFGHRCARILLEVAKQVQSSVSSGMSMQEAWNNALIQMARMSRGYSMVVLLTNVIEGIDDEKRNGSLGQNEVQVMHDLARLFALYWMEREIGDFLEDGYLSAEKAVWVRSNVVKLLDRIRPNAVSLVDAFDISDFRLKSALGRFDGNVYPAILEAAERDPLNETEPGPGYEPHLRRLIRDGAGVYTGTSSRL
jgi:acyl-CoA oxidase